MLEAIVLFIVVGLTAVCAFTSRRHGKSVFARFSGLSRQVKSSTPSRAQLDATERTESSLSYLEQLQREIEETLFPRPTDSVLRRHYDSLVAGEVKNRLSFFS